MHTSGAEWSQIAKLKPRLREHVRILPQHYRGECWYILSDRASGQHMRFNEAAYQLIGRFDGVLTVQQIWQTLINDSAESPITQEEIQKLLGQLFAIDALDINANHDTKVSFKRQQEQRRAKRWRNFTNPLSVRFPLIDPDRFLNHTIVWLRSIFSPTGFAIWLALVSTALILATAHFPALVAATSQDILAPSNLVSMAFSFVLIKALHEMAHAYAVKNWGGEVHEMGITLLVLVPVPYVDASSCWAFREKSKRVLVSLAGIMAELAVAAVALFVWLLVEPGIVQDAAFNALLVGSVSTLLFNGNPLLRFDGYYALQDHIEIPNLYSRSSRYLRYLIQRYVFGMEQAQSPVVAKGERAWFFGYGLSAFIYSLFISVGIVLLLVEQYLVIGVALGAWLLATRFVFPIVRGIRYVITAAELSAHRSRAIVATVGTIGMLLLALFTIPVSSTTHAEGVIGVPDQAQVFAQVNGFVQDVKVVSGTQVEPGTMLVQLASPQLDTRVKVLKARQHELELRYGAEQIRDRVQSRITAEDIAVVGAELADLQQQASALQVRSKVAGTFVIPDQQPLHGGYVQKGQLIGYVIAPQRVIARVVVPQSSIGLVRQRVDGIEVRLAERLNEVFAASISRETPSGNDQLPSRALGVAGGGTIAVQMGDRAGTTAAEKVFQIDLTMPESVTAAGLGERVYVRFDHGTQPLANQWLHSLRQLVLSRFSW